MVGRMPFFESGISLIVGKQRFHPFYFKFHLNIGRKFCRHFLHRIMHLFFGIQGGAYGSKEMGMFGFDDMFFVQF